jgi:hypothetical protein
MVILTFIRLECGSVQIKLASMIRTFDKPLNFRRHRASSSRDSSAAVSQVFGGWSHLYNTNISILIFNLVVMCSGTNLAVTAEMKIGLSLNILGNIDREFYAVMAQST